VTPRRELGCGRAHSTAAFPAALAFALALSGCRKTAAGDSALSAGAATVFDATHDAFSFPAPNLSAEHRTSFFVGNSFFSQAWVVAPASVENRDGLGPLFNARSCSACHFKDGRSRPPEPGEAFTTVLLRISIPGRGVHGEPVPDPIYGDQIQGNAVPGVPREADVIAEYETVTGKFQSGETYTLRRPKYRLEHLGFGAVAEGLLMSARVAPPVIGVGLLEAIPETDLRGRVDPDDADHDGVSGRANMVWDRAKNRPAVGRFGWKAEQPTVLQQVASAFVGDLGITTTVFPAENHTAREPPCDTQPSGGSPEASDLVLRSVAGYARTLGVPARRRAKDGTDRRGEDLFERVRCPACHVPSFGTGPVPDLPELGGQLIHPYTDLLLHDMGEGLSDDRPAFEAGGREWRTAPLWGIGLVSTVNGHSYFLHDGRARSLEEAILWHDGEARAARDAFVVMPAGERAAVIAFLSSL
jgi:CxxC motif-containing protein (DUF1111 family)